MRVLFCGGGTGGHVYPALAVASELAGAFPVFESLYVGAKGEIEELVVPRASIQLETIAGGGLHGVGPMRFVRNLLRLGRGVLQAWRIAGRFRPDVVFSTGGYASVPVVFVAWLRRWPVLVYLPDVEPGWAIKLLGRMATRVAVNVETSRQFFAPKTCVTGYPLRTEFYEIEPSDKYAARTNLGISPEGKVLLVLGGSRGAQSINRALSGFLDQALERMQVIHISGRLDIEACWAQRETLPAVAQERYHLFDYLHEMAHALAAADLVVARAGAATLGEFPFFGLPAILVPYPHAWRYQKVNADFLADRGAAIRLNDADMTEQLWPTIVTLLDDEKRLQKMSQSARALARPNATTRLADLLTRLGRNSLAEETELGYGGH